MIDLGILDVIWAVACLVAIVLFAFSVRFSWISRRALLAFLLVKVTISLTINVRAIINQEDYDAVAYYQVGLRHAEMLGELVSGTSTDFLTTTPFYWIEGISTDRINSFAGVLLTLTGGSFIGATLIMCQIGALGQLLIFRYLRRRFPEANHRYFYLILFNPSLMFWTSSLLKDTLGILALGLIIYHVNEVLTRFRGIHVLAIVIGLYLAYLYRAYTFVVIGGFLLFAYWDRKLEQGGHGERQGIFKLIYVYVAISLSLFIVIYVMRNFGRELVETQRESDVVYAGLGGGSTFQNVQLSFSWGGLLSLPIGVANSLLRPYPWEVSKLNQLAAAFENVVMLAVVIRGWQVYLFRLSRAAKRYSRTVMFGGIVLTVVCASGVGLFSSNLGTISRYRIPIIPMFLAGPCVALALFHSEQRRHRSWQYLQNFGMRSLPVRASIR